MDKKPALYTVFIGTMVAATVGMLGLNALGAGETVLFFAVILPLVTACYLISGIVHNDGFKRRGR